MILVELVAVTHAVCGCSDVVVGQLGESSMRELWAFSSEKFNTKTLIGSHPHIPLSYGSICDDGQSSGALLLRWTLLLTWLATYSHLVGRRINLIIYLININMI